MYDFLEYLHRYCIKPIENWKAVPNLSCEIERGNIVESTEAMIGYHVIVKQNKVIIYDNDIASISNISGNYIAADLLVTRYLDAIGEFIEVSELDQSSYYEWFMFVEETRRIFRGTEIIYQFLKYLFTHTYEHKNEEQRIEKYMKNIIIDNQFRGESSNDVVRLDMKDDNMLFYNFDIYDTNILYEEIDEEKLLRILDEISNTDNYKALFNIVSENQKKFWESNIKPIVSECSDSINTSPFDLYAYVNKYISNKMFDCDNYLITKNEVINFYFNHGSDFNNFKKGQKWTKSNFKQGNKLKIHEFIIAVTYVNLLNHSYMKYINAENYYDSSKKITKGMKNKYHEFTDSFSDFIERVDDITWRIRDSFDYIGGLKNKEISEDENEYIEQLIQFVILSKFGYINVKNHFNYIENLNTLNNELTTILRSEFAHISNDMYNNLFGNLFDVVNTWKKDYSNNFYNNTQNTIPTEKLDIISSFIKQYDKPIERDEHGKHVKAKVFEGISDFYKRVKKGFDNNDVLLHLRLEMSVHENKYD
ncbi:hypothetical protein [Staphylococcus canis]|uniref:Uncharacterized protein n=1 Tax=Staphylococcus canis TaxID=2724942 RepID=A0ABS0TAL3_9STAP|nr:hypothetical protein [Staphylococcus canis]MBI5975006.1 hypothetical protein [Staphylococcus canis]